MLVGLLIALSILLALEFSLKKIVLYFNQSFPWLIISGDESPKLERSEVERHFQRGFDHELGWVRHPNSSGRDLTANGSVQFSIDERGARYNPGYDHLPSQIAVFGDSFAFCRLVDNQNTWPHFLSSLLKSNTRNFGVGNYGFDQALLRLERELPELDGSVVIMAVVPETMARIHSYWKHYFEYGNVLAFKPRFTQHAGVLRFHPMMLKSIDDYLGYEDRLDEIKALDPFYQNKFQPDVLRFPFLLHVLRRWSRSGRILWELIRGCCFNATEQARKRAFGWVLEDNAKVTARLYKDAEARTLMALLVNRFTDVCKSFNRTPILVVLPQPIDLARYDRGFRDYQSLMQEMQSTLIVEDMTPLFLEQSDRSKLYCEGALGPHTSPYANRLIASRLETIIRPLLASAKP